MPSTFQLWEGLGNSVWTCVLVLLGCCNGALQPESWVKPQQWRAHLAGSPRRRRQHGHVLRRACFLAHGGCVLTASSPGAKGQDALWSLFHKSTNLIHDLSTCQRRHLLIPLPFAVRISACGFGGGAGTHAFQSIINCKFCVYRNTYFLNTMAFFIFPGRIVIFF